MKPHVRIALLFLAVGLASTIGGFLPGRTLAPLDIPLDYGAWKHDPAVRVRPANSLLSDVIVQFIPWDNEVRRLVASGELPWTNRWNGDGGPLFANPQAALLSPFTWPRYVFGLDGWAVMALLKIFAAAAGAYWLSRELDVERREAVVSGLVYALCGFVTVWLLWPHSSVAAVLPAFAAAAMRLMKKPNIHSAALVILTAALCTTGGHPESLFIGIVSIWIFLVWEAEKRRELGATALIPPAVGALLGFLLCAVQIVPFLALLPDTSASSMRPALAHPFRAWSVLSELLPGILGSPLRGELDLTSVVGAESFNHRTGGFVGALVIAAIVICWRELSPSLRRGVIIGTIGLVASWYPPGLWRLVRHAPVLRVTALEYGAIPFALFASIASGPALVRLASRVRRKAGLALVTLGIVVAIAGATPALPAARGPLTRVARNAITGLRQRGFLHQSADVYEQRLAYYLDAAGTTTLRRVALPGVIWAIAGAALLTTFRRRDLVVASAAIAELFAFGYGFNPAVRMTEVPREPDVIAAIKQLDPDHAYLLAAEFTIFPANMNEIYGVRDIVSYDVLTSRSRTESLAAASYEPLAHSIHPLLSPTDVDALARLGARYVLSRDDVPRARRVAGAPAPAVGVYEIAAAQPVPIPPNRAPRGVIVGAVLSLIAVLASAGWLRLFLLQPPDTVVTMLQPSATAS